MALNIELIDRVGVTYESLKDSVNDLFADMVPAAHCQTAISPRIQKIFEKIRDLRDLACEDR